MRILVLTYHDVITGHDFDASGFPGRSAASYKVALKDFEAHLQAIAADSKNAGLAIWDVLEPRAKTPVVLTFDDGGCSYHGIVADLLEQRRWRGHVLMSTDYIGTRGFLTAADLRNLHSRGHVVGSHSGSHPLRMASWPVAKLREEWRRSVTVLSDLLGAPVHCASIPGGQYSKAVAETAAEAGIRVLFTSEPTARIGEVSGCRIVGRFALRRYHDASHVRDLLRTPSRTRAAHWIQWNTKKLAKTVAGTTYLRLRQLRWPD